MYTCVFCLTKFNLCRQCLSSSTRPDRQQNWTRRGSYWRQGSRRLRTRARNGLRWWLRPKDDAKELQNLVEELKIDAIEKDTRLDHLRKRNDELSTLLEKAKGDAVAEFKASKQYTNLLDTNYAVGFEDFRMEAMENFPEVDFSSIKLNLGGTATSSLLQTSSKDINIEDNATTQPV